MDSVWRYPPVWSGRRGARVGALRGGGERQGLGRGVPAGVVGQAWRQGSGQALLARLLSDPVVEVVPLDLITARAAGVLCGKAGHPDVIDASVVVCARE